MSLVCVAIALLINLYIPFIYIYTKHNVYHFVLRLNLFINMCEKRSAVLPCCLQMKLVERKHQKFIWIGSDPNQDRKSKKKKLNKTCNTNRNERLQMFRCDLCASTLNVNKLILKATLIYIIYNITYNNELNMIMFII